MTQTTGCIGNDPACPCQDGDACHYRDIPGSPAWPITAEQWRAVAREQSKIIERMVRALRRIRDMEEFEFDQRDVAQEALNESR